MSGLKINLGVFVSFKIHERLRDNTFDYAQCMAEIIHFFATLFSMC